MWLENFSYKSSDTEMHEVGLQGLESREAVDSLEQQKQNDQLKLRSLTESILPRQDLIDGHMADYDIEGNFVWDRSEFADMGEYEFVV